MIENFPREMCVRKIEGNGKWNAYTAGCGEQCKKKGCGDIFGTGRIGSGPTENPSKMCDQKPS